MRRIYILPIVVVVLTVCAIVVGKLNDNKSSNIHDVEFSKTLKQKDKFIIECEKSGNTAVLSFGPSIVCIKKTSVVKKLSLSWPKD